MQPESEFTRQIAIDRIGRTGQSQHIEATESELAALATRLKIPAVKVLSADVKLDGSVTSGSVTVTGQALATVIQECVVTGDMFSLEIACDIHTVFVEEIAPDDAEEISDDDVDQIINGRIDIGELAVQYIAMSLDPYPRKPGAVWHESDPEAAPPNPFSILQSLKKDH